MIRYSQALNLQKAAMRQQPGFVLPRATSIGFGSWLSDTKQDEGPKKNLLEDTEDGLPAKIQEHIRILKALDIQNVMLTPERATRQELSNILYQHADILAEQYQDRILAYLESHPQEKNALLEALSLEKEKKTAASQVTGRIRKAWADRAYTQQQQVTSKLVDRLIHESLIHSLLPKDKKALTWKQIAHSALYALPVTGGLTMMVGAWANYAHSPVLALLATLVCSAAGLHLGYERRQHMKFLVAIQELKGVYAALRYSAEERQLLKEQKIAAKFRGEEAFLKFLEDQLFQGQQEADAFFTAYKSLVHGAEDKMDQKLLGLQDQVQAHFTAYQSLEDTSENNTEVPKPVKKKISS